MTLEPLGATVPPLEAVPPVIVKFGAVIFSDPIEVPPAGEVLLKLKLTEPPPAFTGAVVVGVMV
jgi:hypothetical protein